MGNIDDKEMYHTFNMGMGFAIIISQKDVEKSLKILKKYTKSNVKIVGKIEKGSGVEFKKLNLIYN